MCRHLVSLTTSYIDNFNGLRLFNSFSSSKMSKIFKKIYSWKLRVTRESEGGDSFHLHPP